MWCTASIIYSHHELLSSDKLMLLDFIKIKNYYGFGDWDTKESRPKDKYTQNIHKYSYQHIFVNLSLESASDHN